MSKQGNLILDILQTSSGHMSADEIYFEARQRMPGIGIATVYRNLKKLSSDGLIRHIEIPNHPDQFDKTTTPHEHLYCVKCNRIFDSKLDLSGLEEGLNDEGVKVLGYSLNIFCICQDCLAKEGNN